VVPRCTWLTVCGDVSRDDKVKKKKRKAAKNTLSFAMDDEGDGEEAEHSSKGKGKGKAGDDDSKHIINFPGVLQANTNLHRTR
jgi:hypothetical protein